MDRNAKLAILYSAILVFILGFPVWWIPSHPIQYAEFWRWFDAFFSWLFSTFPIGAIIVVIYWTTVLIVAGFVIWNIWERSKIKLESRKEQQWWKD